MLRRTVVGPVSTAEAWMASGYFLLYLAWLFRYRESELEHWPTLVLLPLALTVLLRLREGRRFDGGATRAAGDLDGAGSGAGEAVPAEDGGRWSAVLRGALGSFGIRRDRLGRGLPTALVLGVAIGLFQVRFARAGEAFGEAARSGRVVWLLPLAFLLLLATTGLTEEFFFRGFLQTRVEALTRSRWMAWVAASLAFGVYHVPYAYFNPAWPSAGDWGAAWSTAMVEGTLGGVVLGGLYLWSGGNLLACVVLHAMVDAFPAVGLIRFGGS